jgi:copper transport protein
LLSAVALVGVGAALATSGHASTAKPEILTSPAVFLHGVAITLWIGSLVPLYALIRTTSAGTNTFLSRFSRTIPLVLLLLVASGALLAIVQIEHVNALWTTDYGRVFLLKCFALFCLFGLAVLNRVVLAPAYQRGNTEKARWLSKSIGLEAVLALTILALVGLWRFTPPPRALADVAKAPFFTHIHTERAMADVTVNPANVGVVRTTIVLRKPEDDTVLEAKEVRIILSNPTAGSVARQATKGGDNNWHVDDLAVSVAGRWRIEVDVVMPDARTAVLEASVEIRP